MKLAGHIAKSFLPKVEEPKIVEKIAVIGGWKTITPTLSSEIQCPTCNSKECATPVIDPKSKDSGRVWICLNPKCSSTHKLNTCNHPREAFIPKRVREWPLFCQINGIGDENYNVKFEKIKQNEAKISYMLKFLEKPKSIIQMEGKPGTGKTYCALGMCEFFTRKNDSCIFTTQKQMHLKWLETFNNPMNDYVNKISTVELLVVDDFGIEQPTPAFMSFFMDLINTRIQWSNRGTVITTNLDVKDMSKFCGEALADRLRTGQRFTFKGESRREPEPI